MGALGFAATGIALGLAAGISPGPLLTLVLQRTLRAGWIAGALVALGMLVADLPVVAVTAWLVAHAVDLDVFVASVSLLGAAFLLALGWHGMNVTPPDPTRAARPRGVEGRRALHAGFWANLLNPNLYLFWATVGATTLAASWADGTASTTAFLITFYVGLVGSKFGVAVLAAQGRSLVTGEGYVWLNRVLAVLLWLFAVRFLWLGIHRLDAAF